MTWKLKPITELVKPYEPTKEELRRKWEGDPEERAKRLSRGNSTRRLLEGK